VFVGDGWPLRQQAIGGPDRLMLVARAGRDAISSNVLIPDSVLLAQRPPSIVSAEGRIPDGGSITEQK
jgi:hypothetical protein